MCFSHLLGPFHHWPTPSVSWPCKTPHSTGAKFRLVVSLFLFFLLATAAESPALPFMFIVPLFHLYPSCAVSPEGGMSWHYTSLLLIDFLTLRPRPSRQQTPTVPMAAPIILAQSHRKLSSPRCPSPPSPSGTSISTTQRQTPSECSRRTRYPPRPCIPTGQLNSASHSATPHVS